MNTPRRPGAKIQMKCHDCRCACAPKDGDWHDNGPSQIFLCRACESRSVVAGPRMRARLQKPEPDSR